MHFELERRDRVGMMILELRYDPGGADRVHGWGHNRAHSSVQSMFLLRQSTPSLLASLSGSTDMPVIARFLHLSLNDSH